MQERHPFCREFATQRRVQRYIGSVRRELATGYVLGRSQWHFRSHPLARFNWTIQLRLYAFLFFVVADDREDIAYSMAYLISTTNSSSRTMMVMFSMTPADLNKAAKKS